MKILAIDSGYEKTGFAVFDFKEKKEIFLISGLIKTSKNELPEKRLGQIYEELKKIIELNSPDLIILEQIFFFKNQKTIVKVAQAQGAVMLLASQNKIPVVFLTPLQIKQTVTGYGRSDKKSIHKMLKMLMKDLPDTRQDDQLDAIACGLAYCYLNRG